MADLDAAVTFHGTSDLTITDTADYEVVSVVATGRSWRRRTAEGPYMHGRALLGAVLEAALRVRSDLPFACKGGVCGTCRARVVEGTVAMDANWALEPDEIERGYVLTCQSHPASDRVVVDFDG